MASAAGTGAGPVRGRLDIEGRLVSADPELEALQREAGSALGRGLAIPQVAAIARLAQELGTEVSRPAIAASASEDIELWVSAAPSSDGGVDLSLDHWRARPAGGPRLGPLLAVASGTETGTGSSPLEWSADEQLRIIDLSADFARLLAVDPSAAAGMPLTRLLQLEENDDGDMPIIGALAARSGFRDQHARLRSDQERPMILSGEIVTTADGAFAGFRGIAAVDGGDSSVHPADGERQVDQALDELLSEPLDRIIESAGRIIDRSDGPLRGDYASYGNDIAAAARHLSSVIRGMRDDGGSAGGEDIGDLQAVDVAALAAEAVVMVEPEAEARGVEIALHADAPIQAAGQERAIIQILVNLIGNAIRYSDPGKPVDILFERTEGAVSIAVRDQGQGIGAADLERIFERFERAHEGAGGTGLGLAISRRLARAMEGDIGVASEPGVGSTFTLILPRA